MDTLNKPLQQVPINNQLTQTNNPGKYRFIETKLNNINTNIINPTTKLDSKNSSLIIIILILILILILIYFNKSIEIKSEIDYRNMMPRLSPNKSAASIDEIFNSRQIYITDAKITPEYIKYIRTINETEEEKYNTKYSTKTTHISRKIFKRRPDQYGYKTFCNLALQGKLIYNETIKYNNTPEISVILPSYNKRRILLKSIRSIQNQKFNNIEIIIVNDRSTDNSEALFDYLLKTDPRIRIFHHMKNMGCWRSRLDGILYSKGKYIILFDTGDLYQDNYVLQNAYDVITKYRLDSCKFLFRVLTSFKRLGRSAVFFHVGNGKIVYTPGGIFKYNRRVFSKWGNIWNRLVRANVYIKGIMQYNKLMLNLYKNFHDDVWCNRMVNRNSFSYAIFERVGYVYLQNGYGEGSLHSGNRKQKSKLMNEFVGFLYYNYNFAPKTSNKTNIVNSLRKFNIRYKRLSLKNIIGKFEILDDFLEALIKDPGITYNDKKFLKQLLTESKERQQNLKNKKKKY